MLQANEITQRFQHLQATIDEAQRVCKESQDAPDEVRNVIERISQEYRQAQPVMASNDEARIVAAVDKLEDMGDEARRLSRSSPQMPAQLEAAVTRVHAELSEFKHKLH
jgi:5'-deoxynucleotidase YfbR-like HD superfamily hydrolase